MRILSFLKDKLFQQKALPDAPQPVTQPVPAIPSIDELHNFHGLISGDVGSGKTLLMDHLCMEAYRKGYRILYFRGEPQPQGLEAVQENLAYFSCTSEDPYAGFSTPNAAADVAIEELERDSLVVCGCSGYGNATPAAVLAKALAQPQRYGRFLVAFDEVERWPDMHADIIRIMQQGRKWKMQGLLSFRSFESISPVMLSAFRAAATIYLMRSNSDAAEFLNAWDAGRYMGHSPVLKKLPELQPLEGFVFGFDGLSKPFDLRPLAAK